MIVVIRGGGDLASGVAYRLHKAGFQVVITELAQPLAVRRLVSFAEAVYSGMIEIEAITGKCVKDPTDTLKIVGVLAKGQIPVLVDPEGESIRYLHPKVVIDARMLKREVELFSDHIPLILGLGPGFIAGRNCHAVIETNRGHMLGRVIWEGGSEVDTGIPEGIGEKRSERVLRAPASGYLRTFTNICDAMEKGKVIAEVAGEPILAPFDGVLRGLLHDGVEVSLGLKVGDLDPRNDPSYCRLISDKALAIGGGVLEAILTRTDLRKNMWDDHST